MSINIHIHHTEQTLLGTFIAGGGVYFLNKNLLNKNHFNSEQHQYIFSVIEQLYKKQIPVDIYLLLQDISPDRLSFIGGKSYLQHLVSLATEEENLYAYYEILKQEFMRAEMKKLGEQFVLFSMQPELKVENIYRIAIAKLEQQLEAKDKENTKSLLEVMTSIFKSYSNKNTTTLIPTGIEDIDAICGGLERGTITLLGGRTGMGKTSFLLNLAIHIAIANKTSLGYVTLADGNQLLAKRSLDLVERICKEKALDKKVFSDDIAQRIILSDQYVKDSENLLSGLQRLVNLHNTKVVILDYLQLMGKGNFRRHHELDTILRMLKSFAYKHNIALVIVSQLNRFVETRGGDKKPEVSGLRECGTLEEIADMIWLLYRPAYYGLTVDEFGNDATNTTELIIAKNNHGATGTVYLKSDSFLPEFNTTDDSFFNKIDINRIKEIIEQKNKWELFA